MAKNFNSPPVTVRTSAILVVLAWALIALAFASLAPPGIIPQFFHNYHAEHFAAFWVVAFIAAVALPSVSLTRIGVVLGVIAVLFAAFRILALVNKVFYAEDLLCDLAGVIAALAAIFVGCLRQSGRLVP